MCNGLMLPAPRLALWGSLTLQETLLSPPLLPSARRSLRKEKICRGCALRPFELLAIADTVILMDKMGANIEL